MIRGVVAMHMNIKRLFLVTIMFFCASNAQDNYEQKFKNVLLIINFNHPYYANIEFIKKLYAPFFKDIIFYGEEPHPMVNQIKTEKGFYVSELMYQVLENYPDHEGYLFLEDDCILNIWNCLSLDLNKIWLLPGFTRSEYVQTYPHFITTHLITGQATEAWGWSWRAESTKRAFSKLLPHDLENITYNVGKDCAIASAADMFYFPARYRTQVMRMCLAFKDVFIEVAMPCILACLDKKEQWEKVSIWFEVSEEYLKKQWPTEQTCVHPIKLSSHMSRQRVLDIFSRKIPALKNYYEQF